MSLQTSGERRALSDHADLILNDTEDGVNVVVQNRDKVPYVLNFNFTQTENMKLEVKGSTKLTDTMKCSLEVPSGAVLEIGDFNVVNEDVTSIAVRYNVQCLIRNPRTGKLEKCPTARNQELDVPPLCFPISPNVTVVAKQTPKGYNVYVDNKGNAANVNVDFSDSTNAEAEPLDTSVKKVKDLLLSMDVGPNCVTELASVGPARNGPFKINAKGNVKGPGSSSGRAAKPVPKSGGDDDDGWDKFGGGDGDGGGEDWEQHGDGGGEGWDEFGGGSGAGGGHPAAAASPPSSPTSPLSPVAAAAKAAIAAKLAAAGGAGGPRRPDVNHPSMSDAMLVAAFPGIHRDFGNRGPSDSNPDPSKWTIYKKVVTRWEEERVARIKLEAEYKVRFENYLKQWWESVCNICKLLLLETGTRTPVVKYKEYTLHKVCYERADKCSHCKEILVGDYVIAKGASGKDATKLHNVCIEPYKKKTRPVCSVCNAQIMDAKWGTQNGTAFHFACKK